jgi:Mn2+/Fe2+ NRAMP family transporter
MPGNRSPLAALKSVGPAIIVAAVVLGPGSVIVSSRVGAVFGYSAVWVLVLAIILLIAMVRLAAHIGLVYERTPCQEIAQRLGNKTAIALGVILFLIIACFQTSNNIAVAAAIEPLFGAALPSWAPAAAIVSINGIVLAILYILPSLYKRIEAIMKILVLTMIVAFLTNAVAAAPSILETLKGILPVLPRPDPNLAKFADHEAAKALKDPFAIIGALIATTFSIAAAFYQAYLVRERGWTVKDSARVRSDTSFGIVVLGAISLIIMVTSASVFYGKLIGGLPAAATLKSATDVAAQLAPLFGDWAKLIFGLGIFAAAISSFLVNAMIGGTILSDSLGLGAKIRDRWPRHLTALALVFGMVIGLLTVTTGFSTVSMITFAQALTVLGVPALAAALLYLGTRPELTGERRLPRRTLSLAYLGTAVVVVLAVRKATSLIAQLFFS